MHILIKELGAYTFNLDDLTIIGYTTMNENELPSIANPIYLLDNDLTVCLYDIPTDSDDHYYTSYPISIYSKFLRGGFIKELDESIKPKEGHVLVIDPGFVPVYIPEQEAQERVQKLRKVISEKGIDTFLSEAEKLKQTIKHLKPIGENYGNQKN